VPPSFEYPFGTEIGFNNSLILAFIVNLSSEFCENSQEFLFICFRMLFEWTGKRYRLRRAR
jgi:hypothetical protein